MTVDRTRTIRTGDWVRCEREAPAKGTWARYAGRVGRVVTTNHADYEYGVRFTAGTAEPLTWFRPDELIRVTRPQGSPAIRTDRERRDEAEVRSKCSAPAAGNGSAK